MELARGTEDKKPTNVDLEFSHVWNTLLVPRAPLAVTVPPYLPTTAHWLPHNTSGDNFRVYDTNYNTYLIVPNLWVGGNLEFKSLLKKYYFDV